MTSAALVVSLGEHEPAALPTPLSGAVVTADFVCGTEWRVATVAQSREQSGISTLR